MSTPRPDVWLVGECNPHSRDPIAALFPLPTTSAGARLCYGILLMDPERYLSAFRRVNLCDRWWSAPEARRAAADVWARVVLGGDLCVLLGAKVRDAFARAAPAEDWPREFFERRGRWLLLPHPSRRCRVWNVPGTPSRARRALRALAPWLVDCVPR